MVWRRVTDSVRDNARLPAVRCGKRNLGVHLLRDTERADLHDFDTANFYSHADERILIAGDAKQAAI
jgi:hypothetical protein